MRERRRQRLAAWVGVVVLMLSPSSSMLSASGQDAPARWPTQAISQRAPILGADLLYANDFTTVFGVNVEQGAQAAFDAAQKFLSRGLQAKLVAIELSNEPWLNYRPWQPEEYAARAADVIERLTPLGVRFALPLTVGNDNNTPTKLTDTVWNTRMLQALTKRIDLKR